MTFPAGIINHYRFHMKWSLYRKPHLPRNSQILDYIALTMVLAKSKNAVGLGNSLMNDRFGRGKGADRKKVSAGIHRTGVGGETVILVVLTYLDKSKYADVSSMSPTRPRRHRGSRCVVLRSRRLLTSFSVQRS